MAPRDLGSVPLFPVEEGMPGVERIPLPFRDRLERSFDAPLDHLRVLTGQAVSALLADLAAEAAHFANVILLADRHAPADVLFHEVTHALQSQGTPAPNEALRVLPADHPAEVEAAAMADTADAPAGGVVTESVPTGTLSLRASTIPRTPSPSKPTEEEKFELALEGETPAPADKAGAKKAPAAAPPVPAPAGGAGTDGSLTVPKAAEEAPNPTFELAPMPETELSADEQAARAAEAEAVKAAIEAAETAEAVVAAYADAPPTTKAAVQPILQSRIAEVAAADHQGFQGDLPEFHATMGGADVPEVADLTAPAAGPVDLEPAPPAPAPEVELPATPTLEPFRENDDVLGFLDRLFGGGPSEAIGKSLHKIQTTDPDVDTSPGEKPEVPLEGETDPQRVEDQADAAKAAADAKREEATKAVVEGRGPEQAQLHEMDEVRSTEALRELHTAPLAGSSEAEQLAQLQMPEEVLDRFDQDLGSTMQVSMAQARTDVGAAETDRDATREEHVAAAHAEQERLTKESDDQQRAQVLGARQTIQTERQAAIDGQASAVAQLETDAEQERATAQADIQDRVAADEQKVGEEYDTAETKAKTEVDKGDQEAEQKRLDAEKESKDKSWWEQAVDFVKEAFDALKNAIGKIFDAIRSVVSAILDAVKSVVKGLIDLCADFIKGAISLFGEALKGLVDMTIGQVFPELAAELNAGIDSAVTELNAAVDAVAEGLKAGVDLLVDSLNQALNAVLDVFEGAINLGLSVMEAAITGDWSGLAKKLLESVLNLLGVDPEAFYAFIGKVMDTIAIIIDDPLGFLSHLVDSVVLGIQNFADHFLVHLKAGVVAWLTGTLGDLQMPAEFNLAGVLDLARQVLGLTWDWVRAKAVKLVGEENVARLEYMFGYVQTLIEGGFPALWERLKQDLGDLVDKVLGSISGYLQEQVIVAGIKWLVSLFNPVGAIVKLVMTIWNLYEFLRDQLSRIMAIVTSVVEGLGDIARGVIEGAAQKVEGTLADLLPVAIDLIAKLLGLNGVGEKVKEVIGNIREWVDKAIDRLLDAVLQAFKPAPPKAEEDGEAPAEAAAAVSDVGVPMKVEVADGADHVLTIATTEHDAVPMLASVPQPVGTWLDDLAKQVSGLKAEKQKDAAGLVETARAALAKLDPAADAYIGAKEGWQAVRDGSRRPGQAARGPGGGVRCVRRHGRSDPRHLRHPAGGGQPTGDAVPDQGPDRECRRVADAAVGRHSRQPDRQAPHFQPAAAGRARLRQGRPGRAPSHGPGEGRRVGQRRPAGGQDAEDRHQGFRQQLGRPAHPQGRGRPVRHVPRQPARPPVRARRRAGLPWARRGGRRRAHPLPRRGRRSRPSRAQADRRRGRVPVRHRRGQAGIRGVEPEGPGVEMVGPPAQPGVHQEQVPRRGGQT